MRYLIAAFLRLRYAIKPEVRTGLDALGLFFAVTLFFALIQSASDGITKRNPIFDDQRWWIPAYHALGFK